MKKSKIFKFFSVIVMLMVFLICFGNMNTFTAFAYNESDYENAGMNFLKAQYSVKNLEYNSLEKEDAINLYSYEDKVIAKVLVLNRDQKLDYVILDFLIDDIITYGFDGKEFLESFYNKGKIYYAGQSNYAYKLDNKFYDLTGTILESDSFINLQKTYINNAPMVESGFDGILSWSGVRSDAGQYGVLQNSDWKYVEGFDWMGLKENSSGVKANYFNQTVFNNQYGNNHAKSITGTCGPTAMTNMAIYFDWLGFDNALINGSAYDTFEWFLNDLNWFNWEGVWWKNTKNSFVNYAKNRGYNYSITNYDNPSISDFKKQIEDNRLIYTYLYVKQTDDYDWAHAVVTVGYEEFSITYEVNNRWWLFGWHDNWVTKTDSYYYLRCIDGWSTSNNAQYIKYDNFYTTIMASAFKLK